MGPGRSSGGPGIDALGRRSVRVRRDVRRPTSSLPCSGGAQPLLSAKRGCVDVSVVVAVRDGAATLRQCLDSILAQEGSTLELIVVDGLSTDTTPEIIASYSDARIVSIREADAGIYDAWNKALGVARGEWCAFLGSDDSFASAASLASLVEVARLPGRAPTFVYGGVRMVGAVEEYVSHPELRDPIAHLRRGLMLPHPGSLHCRRTLLACGGFDASYRIVGDRPAVLRLARLGEVRRCDAIVTDARVGGMSSAPATRGIYEAEWFRFLREERGLSTAVRLLLLRRAERSVGVVLEAVLTRVLGRTLGMRVVLALRRRLGRPPR